eukprot:COSAG04_NODE_9642_length_845_cov_1.096515_2_plen_165_part_01
MAVNLRSVYLLCRGCLPYLTAAGRSAIVNVASIQGSRGFSGYPGYAATKAGDPNEHSTPNEISENSFCGGLGCVCSDGLKRSSCGQGSSASPGRSLWIMRRAASASTRSAPALSRQTSAGPALRTSRISRRPAPPDRCVPLRPCLCFVQDEAEQGWALSTVPQPL